MGGKIPRYIKEKVIRQWLNGLTREEIARKNDIGAGTVTAIVQDAKKQEEYNDIDLLREVSRKLKEEGLSLPSLGFAIRLKRKMEENDINEDQIEPIIQDFAIYSLRYKIPYDAIIKSGREALYLEQKFGVPIEKIPEYITQGKETIDRLEDQRQEILRSMQLAREERDAKRQELDTIAAKVERYRKEIPSIQCIIELKNMLEEERKKNKLHEISERVLGRDLNDARLEATRLEAEVIEKDARLKDAARLMSRCQNELDKLGKYTDK
jgi:hypothetical protein